METWLSQKPVLIYDRIEANRRNTLLLLGVFAVVFLPFALYVIHQVMAYIAMLLLPALLGWEEIMNNPMLTVMLAGIWALFMVFLATYLAYLYSSRLVLRITNARPLKDGEGRELRRIVENLCIGSGLPQPRLAVMDSMATNAFSTGLDPEHASLVVTRGLLEALDRRELEGVTAQELSQIGNYDIRLNTVVAALVTIMWLPLLIVKALLRTLWRRRLVGCLVGGCLLLFGLPLIVAMVLMFMDLAQLMYEDILLFGLMLLPFYFLLGPPFIGMLILRAISREREFLADADAALLTRYPAGLARALAKLGTAGNAKMQINRAVANLYIVNPLSEGNRFWDRMLSSHPPIKERIAQLARMGGVTPSMVQEAEEAGRQYYQAVVEGQALLRMS